MPSIRGHGHGTAIRTTVGGTVYAWCTVLTARLAAAKVWRTRCYRRPTVRCRFYNCC